MKLTAQQVTLNAAQEVALEAWREGRTMFEVAHSLPISTPHEARFRNRVCAALHRIFRETDPAYQVCED